MSSSLLFPDEPYGLCRDCKHWAQLCAVRETYQGRCRALPPTVATHGQVARWPTTEHTDSCSAFAPSKDADEPTSPTVDRE